MEEELRNKLTQARVLPKDLAIDHTHIMAIIKHLDVPNRNLCCLDVVTAYPRKITAYMDRESLDYKKAKNLVYKNLSYIIARGILVRFLDKGQSIKDLNIIDEELYRLYMNQVSAHPLGDQVL